LASTTCLDEVRALGERDDRAITAATYSFGHTLLAAETEPPLGSKAVKCARVCRVCSLWGMTYVIAGSCIKDDSCIEVCPVDCIHPKPGAPDFETAEQLYIDPQVCIDCDACVEACPVDAIFAEFELPAKYEYALQLNEQFFDELSTAERTAA
jgi:ferredoxin